MLTFPLLFSILASTALSLFLLPTGIRLALRYGWLDLPSARKRHKNPVPIIGGVCIFAAWTFGMLMMAALSNDWSSADRQSLLVTTLSIWALIGLGLLDDLRGLSPRIKLAVQFTIAVLTVIFEPNLNAICAQKAALLPEELRIPLIYVPAVIWVVGVMNAINLIDGIDGFAGGTSLLIAICTLALNLMPGGGNAFGAVSLAMVIGPLGVFLRHNWSPAKIFLGDNGSLTLGYLLALNGLIHRQEPNLLVGIPGLFVMYAYPILDMGLCTYRRLKNGYPIFKADRSHLHHRIQRLDLTKGQTTGLLLCVVAYSQIVAIFMNSVHFQLLLVAVCSFALSIFIFLYLLRAAEEWRARSILQPHASGVQAFAAASSSDSLQTVVTVNLKPLLEVGFHEERADVGLMLSSLTMLINRSIRARDQVYIKGTQLCIALHGEPKSDEACAKFVGRLRGKLSAFQSLYGIQYSIVGLPVDVLHSPVNQAHVPYHSNESAEPRHYVA